ncbi:MAG: hypothetical protein MJ094_01855 [Saccharofermentans sp.]|nr:hypothetical protein [Saccharofermentans sp.]
MALFGDPKAKKISEYEKKIGECNASIRKYYDEIGRLYYFQYKDMNTDNTKDINTRCESITKLGIQIEDLGLKILYEKGLKRCSACGTENSLQYGFCFSCGAKFPEGSDKEPSYTAPVDDIAPVEEVTEEATPAAEEVAPATEETPAE